MCTCQLTPVVASTAISSGDCPFPVPTDADVSSVDEGAVLEFAGLFDFLLPSFEAEGSGAGSPGSGVPEGTQLPSARAMSKAIALLKQLPALVSVASTDHPSSSAVSDVKDACSIGLPVLLEVVNAEEPVDETIVPLLVEPTAEVFGVFADLFEIIKRCLTHGSGTSVAASLLACELLDLLSLNLARLTATNVDPAEYGIGVGTSLNATTAPFVLVQIRSKDWVVTDIPEGSCGCVLHLRTLFSKQVMRYTPADCENCCCGSLATILNDFRLDWTHPSRARCSD